MPALLFIPPRFALTIDPARFAAFLRAYGGDSFDSLLDARTPRLDLARALFGFVAPERLVEAADLLSLLACHVGHAAITDGAAAAKKKLPTHLPPADLAAVLLTRLATDATLTGVVERALLRFARVVPASPALELVAREPKRARDATSLLTALKALLGRSFVDAFAREDERSAAVHVAVVRRDRARAASVRHARGPVRRVRRDHVVDTIRIDVGDGRIVLRTDDPALESAYADAVGLALFGDAAFFTSAPSYTLRPIVALGSKQLASMGPPGVTRVRVVDVGWDDGEGTAFTAHGSNALAAYEGRGGDGGGYATSMLFRIDAAGVDRPLDVLVRVPHRAEYRSAAHEPLARAALASLGLFAPGSVADDSFTLAPWIHAEWRWRRVLGDPLFDRFCAQRVLVRTKSRMVGGASMGKYGWSYVSFDLKSAPGTKYAVANDPALPSRDLEADELRMWKLDLDAVKRAHGIDLATEPVLPDAAIDGRALDLGLARGRGLDLRFFAVLRSPGGHARDLADAMVRAAGTAHAIVLLPEGKTIGAGVEISLSTGELFGSGGIAAKVYARVAEKKGLAHGVVDAFKLAAPGVRFVGEEKTGRIWLDGHELAIPDAGAKTLLRVAKGAGAPVRTGEIVAFVSPKRGDDGVVRQTVPKLGGWIRQSFADAGKTAPGDADDIVEWVPNKGWRMKVKCEVR